MREELDDCLMAPDHYHYVQQPAYILNGGSVMSFCGDSMAPQERGKGLHHPLKAAI